MKQTLNFIKWPAFLFICSLVLFTSACTGDGEKDQTPVVVTDTTPPIPDTTDGKGQSGFDAAGLKDWGAVEVEYSRFRVFLNMQDLNKVRFLPYKLAESELNARLYCFAQDRRNNQIEEAVFIPATSETEPDRRQTIGDTAFILTRDEIWEIENAEPKTNVKMLRFVSNRADFPNCRNCISYEIFKDENRVNVRLNPSPPGKMTGDTSLIQ